MANYNSNRQVFQYRRALSEEIRKHSDGLIDENPWIIEDEKSDK